VVPTPVTPSFPPVSPAGNAPLQAALDAATDTIEADTPSVDKIVNIDLEGNAFTVEFLENNLTFAHFIDVAKPVFDVFKNNTVVNTANVTIQLSDGVNASISDNSVTNYTNLEDILTAALAKVKMSKTDSVQFLKGSKVTFQITGTYNAQTVNTTYTFDFAK